MHKNQNRNPLQLKNRNGRHSNYHPHSLPPHKQENRMYFSDFRNNRHHSPEEDYPRHKRSIFSPIREYNSSSIVSEPPMYNNNIPYSFNPNYKNNNSIEENPLDFQRGRQTPNKSPYKGKNFIGTSSNFQDARERLGRLSVPTTLRNSVVQQQPKGDITAPDLGLDGTSPFKRYIGDIYPGVGPRKRIQEEQKKFYEDYESRNSELRRKFQGDFDRYDKPGWRVLNQDPYYAPMEFYRDRRRGNKNCYFEFVNVGKEKKRRRTTFLSHKDIEKEYEKKRRRKMKILKEKRRKEKEDPKWVNILLFNENFFIFCLKKKFIFLKLGRC